MSRRLLKWDSRCEDVTQRKLDLGPRTQRQVSVEEQTLESQKRANAIQKKTYSNWISKVHHLDIEDLYTDLRDGKLLIQLLEVVSGEKIPVPSSKGNMPQIEKFLRLERIGKALEFLQQHNVRLENIEPNDIEEGREKETLALIWAIILHYQIVVMPEPEPDSIEPSLGSNNHAQALVTDFEEKTIQVPVTENREKTATKTLLQWCQKTTQGYSGVKVIDFTNSWKDGLAFNAIIHKHRSDLIDFESLEAKNITDNLNNAFDIAEKQLGIPKLLDTEDMVFPDPRSVVVYISLFYSFFGLKHPEQPPSPVVPVFVPTPDPPHVERAQLQESGNKIQASTESGTQSVPEVPISAPNPDPPNMERTQNQELASKPQSASRIQSQASTGTGTLGTQSSQPSTMPAPSAPPPYSPPKYTPYPTYQQPYQQPCYQQPYQQPYYQKPYQQPYYQQPYQQPYYPQPYYQQPYQQQPYRPAYYQQPPYAAPPMQMMQQQTIQVQTGLGMLTVGAQQGGGMQSSFMKLGSTTVGAAPPAKPTAYTPSKPTAYQPTKPTAYAPTKNKGKKSKK